MSKTEPANKGLTTTQQPGALKKSRFLQGLLERSVPGEAPDEMDWQQDADFALMEQAPIRSRALLYCIALSVVLIIIWSAFAEVDEVTRGEGKVIPSRQVQIIQSIDGGMLSEILINEGDIVERNELLFRIDQTRFASSLREKELEFMALKIRAARLEAITSGSEFALSDLFVKNLPEVSRQEQIRFDKDLETIALQKTIAQQQLEQRQNERTETLAKKTQLEESYKLAFKEYSLTRPLMDSGAVSQVELIRLEREVANLRGELKQTDAQIQRINASIEEAQNNITEVELKYKNEYRDELSQVTAKINSLRESNLGLSDKVKQTSIRSPVRGTVKRLFFNTIGGVVLPGKELVEIVPLDDTLLLEARIKPKDIGFLRPQADALVKFTAYDFVVYGGLDAEVEYIGADTLTDEDGNPYYNIRVRTHESDLGQDKPIIPGMVAEVDILTGKKTILAYILKPVLRAKQYAMSER